MDETLAGLKKKLKGEIHTKRSVRAIYSTDASIYQQMPLAVAMPKNSDDIACLIEFAKRNGVGLIPRTAGTSLAGQTVGSGIVVDVSKYMNRIIHVSPNDGMVTVQPGVVRDELNSHLRQFGLFFAPETSTSNRAMIGGMLGNNSCGSNSIVYGSTRDYVVEVVGFLSDGTLATFGPKSSSELDAIVNSTSNDLESDIYRVLIDQLGRSTVQQAIVDNFPEEGVRRRNTGYAVDALLSMESIAAIRNDQSYEHRVREESRPFNLAKLIAGSEGTLFFATEIKLRCAELPPAHSCLVCAQFKHVSHALSATQVAMQHRPSRCELIDNRVIGGALRNPGLAKQMHIANIQWGDAQAILMIEICLATQDEVKTESINLIESLRTTQPTAVVNVLNDQQAKCAWEVRKAGLGVVNNIVGDKKPITLIEDTAVSIERLPEFIAAIDSYLEAEYGIECVHYGHAGAGEIHLRPELNLKIAEDRGKLRAIATGVAKIVKQFRGSLSGEHGDGRLRSEFIEDMIGKQCYELMRLIKKTWDPQGIFNPGKIVDPLPMDEDLRIPDRLPEQPSSVFRFPKSGSLLASVEMCSGSGDCRKSHLAGGTMCPSYMASRREYDTTRARANMLRDLLTNPDVNAAFDDLSAMEEVKSVMELCLSCKGCKSECPSNVDMAKIKAEFMNAYYEQKPPSLLTRALAEFDNSCRAVSKIPFARSVINTPMVSGILKRVADVHPARSLPKIAKLNLRHRLKSRRRASTSSQPVGTGDSSKGHVVFFIDEFTNWIDVDIGISAIELLEGLGYVVRIVDHAESGRSAISTGLLGIAKKYADANVRCLSALVGDDCKLVGIEPSAVLTLRDEYPDLVTKELHDQALHLAKHTCLIEEFLEAEFARGVLDCNVFHEATQQVLLHGHCHHKALGEINTTATLLGRVPGVQVELLSSGCCGMAGFFGYQNDKAELSMQIGELILFPAIRRANPDTVIVSSGTSCRHQIFDGTRSKAIHPVELLSRRIMKPKELK